MTTSRQGPARDRSAEELAAIRELRSEIADLRLRRSPDPGAARRPTGTDPPWRRSPSPRIRRRRRGAFALGLILLALALILGGAFRGSSSYVPPSGAALAGLGLRQRIVAIARSQLGYATKPSHSYCNKFSAYWSAGTGGCPSGENAEEWCADFVAWVWRRAGVRFSYGDAYGDVNAGAISLYSWGVVHGRWHPLTSGYRPKPGDVAVYGLSFGTYATAAHVAIVTGAPPGQAGPDVINGDGDHTGFSVVEVGSDQLRSDTGDGPGARLAGYVSPA